jgi:regulator of protease activity HflC (stomatin/prohibitin superfamily)
MEGMNGMLVENPPKGFQPLVNRFSPLQGLKTFSYSLLKFRDMKRITVNPYQRALLFKNGAYIRMLKEGKYWLWSNEKLELYEMTYPFWPSVELNILLKDEQLAAELHVVEVKDHEVALKYENGLLKEVLNPGRYTYWNSIVDYRFVFADVSKIEITENIDRATLLSKQVAPFVRSVSVESFEKAVLFVDGKYAQILQSGIYYWWKNNIPINIGRIDTRQQQVEINGQEILTKDKAALRINAWAQYKVVDIEKAILRNKEYDRQLYVAFQVALREYTSSMTLDELLDKKESLAPSVLQALSKSVLDLGIEVMTLGIRDIILPGDVKEIMNQVLIAEKKAQANIIMRREETASTRSLLNTAKLMEENQMLFKLKEMEYVEKIAEKISTISVNGDGALIDKLKQIFVK